VLDGHVLAAAFEGPIDDADRETLGDAALDRAQLLDELRRTPAGFVWAGKDYPAARISLRSSTPDAVTVVEEETGALLGLVDLERAYSTVHDGAVYLHLGEPYLVRTLDLDSRTALVAPFRGDWYTMAKQESDTSILEERFRERRLGLDLCFGSVVVTEQVVAYQRRKTSDQQPIDLVALDLPETTFETEAVWYVPSERQLEGFDALPRLLGSLHAAEHSMIALLPLWAMCDRWDIGGLSTNLHRQTGRPTVFVYDGHAGGVGIAERGFEIFEGWVEDTERLLARCPCERGCPSCVQSPKCGNLNEPLDKQGALTLLHRMTG
jgi:DEAD/DEAH box helicase domain-containing protein